MPGTKYKSRTTTKAEKSEIQELLDCLQWIATSLQKIRQSWHLHRSQSEIYYCDWGRISCRYLNIARKWIQTYHLSARSHTKEHLKIRCCYFSWFSEITAPIIAGNDDPHPIAVKTYNQIKKWQLSLTAAKESDQLQQSSIVSCIIELLENISKIGKGSFNSGEGIGSCIKSTDRFLIHKAIISAF